MPIPFKEYAALLVAYLRPWRLRMGLLALLLVGGSLVQLAAPQIVRHFIDQVVAGAAPEQLVWAALAFLAAGGLGHALAAGTAFLGSDIAWRATNRLREDLVTHCLRLDLPFHHRHSPGELIERLDGDVGTLGEFFSKMTLTAVANVLLLVGALVALFVEDWRIGLPLACFALVTMGLLVRYREVALPLWQAARQSSAERFAFIGERLGGIDDIRANGAVSYKMRRFYKMERRHFHNERRADLVGGLVVTGLNLVMVLGGVVGLGLGVYLQGEGLLTIGGVYLVTHYAAMLGQPLQRLVDQADDLQQAGASIARIRQVQAVSPQVEVGGRTWTCSPAPTVELAAVSFAYGTGERVLRDIDLRLPGGRVLGLLGRTGSGKSTLTRLLSRLYDPLQGQVLIDGVDLSRCKAQDVRRAVGMVTQDVQLFQASVRDNLCFFSA